MTAEPLHGRPRARQHLPTHVSRGLDGVRRLPRLLLLLPLLLQLPLLLLVPGPAALPAQRVQKGAHPRVKLLLPRLLLLLPLLLQLPLLLLVPGPAARAADCMQKVADGRAVGNGQPRRLRDGLRRIGALQHLTPRLRRLRQLRRLLPLLLDLLVLLGVAGAAALPAERVQEGAHRVVDRPLLKLLLDHRLVRAL